MSMEGHRGLTTKEIRNMLMRGLQNKRISVVTALCRPGMMTTGAIIQLDFLLVMGIMRS